MWAEQCGDGYGAWVYSDSIEEMGLRHALVPPFFVCDGDGRIKPNRVFLFFCKTSFFLENFQSCQFWRDSCKPLLPYRQGSTLPQTLALVNQIILIYNLLLLSSLRCHQSSQLIWLSWIIISWNSKVYKITLSARNFKKRRKLFFRW